MSKTPIEGGKGQPAAKPDHNPELGYEQSSQDDNGQPQNPPKGEQVGNQREQPGQQY
jgi:hypothetical protein